MFVDYITIGRAGLTYIGDEALYDTLDSYSLRRRVADFNLIIDQKYINELESSPSAGLKNYYPALLIDSNNLEAYKGKARYRGDSYFHWTSPRKSWRFKSSKNKILNGERKLNFNVTKGTEILNNHLAYEFSRLMGLLTPTSDIKTFAVNGRYEGVRNLVGQVEEGFLRNNNRMPNDIYVGDNVGVDGFIGVDYSLLHNPGVWQKSAYNNHYQADSYEPLKRFLGDIRAGELGRTELIDFAKLSVLVSMTASRHMDIRHNWKLYYDHYYERMFPITWDLVGWHIRSREMFDQSDSITYTNEIMGLFFAHNAFYQARQRVIAQVLNEKNRYVDLLDREVDKAVKKVKLQTYSLRIGAEAKPIAETTEDIQKLKEHILQRFSHMESVAFPTGIYRWAPIDDGIRLGVNGRTVVEKVVIKSDFPMDKVILKIRVRTSEGETVVDAEPFVELRGDALTLTFPMFSDRIIQSGQVIFREAAHDIMLIGLDNSKIKGVSVVLEDSEHSVVAATEVDAISGDPIQHALLYSEPIENALWSGTMEIHESITINSNVTIAPGTNIKLADAVTIKFLGKVRAVGTEALPIVFSPLGESSIWGAIVLKDEKASDSVFEHCKFTGGSGDKSDLHEYTAMFSLHNVQNVSIRKCSFTDSHLTDDMVHLVYSGASFYDSVFSNSPADALDADISEISIEDSVFEDIGNDAVDLMSTKAVIRGTKFLRADDKGISVGERSRLLAVDSKFIDSTIGVEVKDDSIAYIHEAIFDKNKVAVNAYKKNWRYGRGGRAVVNGCNAFGNQVLFSADKNSEITATSCNNGSSSVPSDIEGSRSRYGELKSVGPLMRNDSFFEGAFFEIDEAQATGL